MVVPFSFVQVYHVDLIFYLSPRVLGALRGRAAEIEKNIINLNISGKKIHNPDSSGRIFQSELFINSICE